MREGASHWHYVTNGHGPRNLKRLLPGLNALAEALLTARVRRKGSRQGGLNRTFLASTGMTRDDCRQLRARGLIDFHGKTAASTRIVLTDAGLVLLQSAIPVGALRPVYEVSSRNLTVAGEPILRLAAQARNLCELLTKLEKAGWPTRVANPLGARPCGGDPHHLAVAAHKLTLRQRLIDFHLDDGAVAWNWRPARGIDRQHAGGRVAER